MMSSYNSPFNLIRRLASLDMISGGRVGWSVVTSFDLGVAGNFGLDENYDNDTRYCRAPEVVDVAKGLWDSYEDHAFPADVERDVFLDPDKLHELNHKGEYVSVTGPLNMSRSPQGQPVIFQSGMSEQIIADTDEAKLGGFARPFGGYDLAQHDPDGPFPTSARSATTAAPDRSARSNALPGRRISLSRRWSSACPSASRIRTPGRRRPSPTPSSATSPPVRTTATCRSG